MEQTRKKGSDFTNSNHNESFSKRKEKQKSSKSAHRFLYHAAPEWYQYHQPVSEFSAGQWSSQGQRLYPTVSDSAVFGYSSPQFDCAMSRGFPIYPVFPANMYSVGLEQVRRPSRVRKKVNKYSDVDGAAVNSNFTSLPPVNIAEAGCSEKRRFSDPGLNNDVNESNESSSASSVSDNGSLVNETLLLEQITELKSENKRLSSELQKTRNELNILKSEVLVISNKVSCHEPFSLAQMVKEIRDAAELREKVLLSKVEILMKKCENLQNSAIVNTDIESLKKRINLLEHQLEHVRIHSKVDSKINGEATTAELDEAAKLKLNAIDGIPKSRIDAERCAKEPFTGLRLDLGSAATNSESTSDWNGHSLSTVSYESLSSSLGPSSVSSATLTVCGPVTDL